MGSKSKLTPLAFSAILVNAALYLVVLSASVQQFVIRHDPAWAFFACEACRETGSSYIIWGFMIAGLAALFVRRPEAVLVLFIVNLFLLIAVAWGPVVIASHVFKENGGSIFAPQATPLFHPLFVWAAQVTVGAVGGSVLLGFPSVRRALSGAPAV